MWASPPSGIICAASVTLSGAIPHRTKARNITPKMAQYTYSASCEIGNTDFRLQPKGIFGCICKLTKLSGETPPGKA